MNGNIPPRKPTTFHTEAPHCGFDMADFQQAQEAHYGFKNSYTRVPEGPAYQKPAYQQPAYQKPVYQPPAYQKPAYQPPKPAPQSSEYTPEKYTAADRKATTRKPVAATKHDSKLGPAPPPHKRTVSADEVGLPPPLMPAEPVAAGAERYIGTTPDGKFDLSNVRPGARARTQRPPADLDKPLPPPPCDRDGAAMPMPKSTRYSDGPHAESGDSVRPGVSRKNSSSSMNSVKSTFRRLSASLRRNSSELLTGLALAAKDPVERREYEREKQREAQRQSSTEREKACRVNPQLRPRHERDALREKNHHRYEAAHVGAPPAANPFTPDRSEQMKAAESRARAEQRNAPYKQREPETSPSADSFESSHSLSPSERQRARSSHGIPDAPPPGSVLNGYDKAGTAVAKLLDPMRRKRSDQSDDFNDAVPPGMMEKCARCQREPETGCLRKGICDRCRAEIKQWGDGTYKTLPK